MKLGRGKAILASNALAAVAGIAVTIALVRLANVDAVRPRAHVAMPDHAQPLPPPVDRLAFAPMNAFPLPELRPAVFAEDSATDLETDVVLDETAALPTETAAPPWQTDLHSAPVSKARRPDQSDRSDQSESDALPRRRRPYSRSLERRLAEIAPGATTRLIKKFEAAKISWPPAEIALIGIKDEKILELHARSKGGPWGLIHRYRILAASGSTGPKLRQGDKQVPEGIYQIAWLNPDSAYHVSLRVSYPNSFDRKMAKKEGRTNLGGDIMIHGKNLSAGCLAIGDEAVEEVFTVAAETGLAKVRVIIAPTDLRTKTLPDPKPGQPEWVPKLYTEIASAMSGYESANPITTGSTNIATSFMSFFSK
ncbi:MAG: murein L,D-transpeptidase family protein [Hyphomicrobiaceae bacterium]